MPEDQYELCRHIHTNGKPCNSPALTEKDLCYFHHKLHQRHRSLREIEARAIMPPPDLNVNPLLLDYYKNVTIVPLADLDLPPLEDPESIQLSISLIISALAAGRVEPKTATALLYGLQLASSNVGKLTLEPMRPVRDFINQNGLELTA